MKLLKNTITIFLILMALNLQAQTWQEVASILGDERHHPVTFSIDGFGYLVTGSNGDDDFSRYDPVADEWTQLTDFPGAARGFSYGVTYEGKGYLGFGAQGTTRYKDLWEYDPTTETWTELTPLPGVPRAHPAMIAGSGKIWVGLGSGPAGNLDDWWEYDIATDSWEEQPDFPSFNRHHPYYFDIDGYPYVGFGHGQNIYRDFYKFDFENDEWIMLNAFPEEGRVAGTQFSHGGKGYILSGQGEDHEDLDTGEFWQYDPDTDSWEELTPHPWGSRWAPGSFVIEDNVYLLCGNKEVGGNQDDMWVANLPTPPVSTDDVIVENQINISPNPTADYFVLDTEVEIAQGSKVAVMDVQGKVVLSFDYESGKNYNVEVLASGTYIITVSNQKESYTSKLFKQ